MVKHLSKQSVVVIAVLLAATVIMAEGGTESRSDILGFLSTIFGVSFAGVSAILMRLMRVISKSKAALNKVTGLCESLKAKVTDPELKKEADHATEAVADVLDELKMNSMGDRLRRLF